MKKEVYPLVIEKKVNSWYWKIAKNLNHAIEDVHYVDSLKYNLLSIFQIGDKMNEVKFMSNKYTVTSIKYFS